MAKELCVVSISTALMVTNHRASIPFSTRVPVQFLGEQAATVPASMIHAVGEQQQVSSFPFSPPTSGALLPPLEESACLGAIGQPINPEWKTSNGAAVVKGIRLTCPRCGQAGHRSPWACRAVVGWTGTQRALLYLILHSLCLFLRVRARCVKCALRPLNALDLCAQLRQCAAALPENGRYCLQNKGTPFVGKRSRHGGIKRALGGFCVFKSV